MKFIKIFFIFVILFCFCGCDTVSEEIEIEYKDTFTEEVIVGKDVLIYNENEKTIDEEKRLFIEKRLKEKKERIKAFENITFKYEYIISDEYMPYGLFTPSVVQYINKMPLIVWLHGSGERGVDESIFNQRGLVGVLNDWELNGFGAYVLCPHLKGIGYNTSWNNSNSFENLMSLINYFKDKYEIDENRIYIVGHSLGAQGALYMTQKEDCFAAQGLLSGYPAYTDIINIDIPTKCFVGTVVGGEDSLSVDFTLSQLNNYFGESSIKAVNGSHGDVPKLVFYEDEDGDNQSDFVNWLLNQRK